MAGFRRDDRRVWALLRAALFATAMLLSEIVQAQAGLEADEVESRLAGFLQSWLGRAPTADETRISTAEFMAYYGAAERCGPICVASLDNHVANGRVLGRDPASPATLLLRHAYVAQSVFPAGDAMGATLARLLTEPDPPVVVNAATRRVITAADVAALIDLARWRQDGPPPRRAATRAQTDAFVAALERIGGARARSMPVALPLAAELRSGLERAWPDLTAAERGSLRRWIREPGAPVPAPSLLASVLESPPETGEALHAALVAERDLAMMRDHFAAQMSALGGAMAQWSMIEALGRAGR